MLHDRNPIYVRLSDGGMRNGYTIKLLNKLYEPHSFHLAYRGAARRHPHRRRARAPDRIPQSRCRRTSSSRCGLYVTLDKKAVAALAGDADRLLSRRHRRGDVRSRRAQADLPGARTMSETGWFGRWHQGAPCAARLYRLLRRDVHGQWHLRLLRAFDLWRRRHERPLPQGAALQRHARRSRATGRARMARRPWPTTKVLRVCRLFCATRPDAS